MHNGKCHENFNWKLLASQKRWWRLLDITGARSSNTNGIDVSAIYMTKRRSVSRSTLRDVTYTLSASLAFSLSNFINICDARLYSTNTPSKVVLPYLEPPSERISRNLEGPLCSPLPLWTDYLTKSPSSSHCCSTFAENESLMRTNTSHVQHLVDSNAHSIATLWRTNLGELVRVA